MARYGKKAGEKVAEAIREMEEGELTVGKSGKKVTSRKQAIAIGLSEAREEGGKVPEKKTSEKSSATNSTGKKTATKKAAGKKSATKKTTAKKASTKDSETKKSAAKKSETKKTAVKSTAKKKPTASKKSTAKTDNA